MANKSPYSHYMQRIDVSDAAVYNLEEDFTNLRYMKAEGMNDVGKSKNIYTEEYADSDRKRVYLPADGAYANEGTTITMTFLIIGTSTERQTTIDQFEEYVRTGIHKYWDTARNREFDFIVVDEIKVSDERWHGDDPYVELQIPMQNLNGKTSPHQS